MSTKMGSPFFASREGLNRPPKSTAKASSRWKSAEQAPAIQNARDDRRLARQIRIAVQLCHAFSGSART
jgi:hypothetical protein